MRSRMLFRSLKKSRVSLHIFLLLEAARPPVSLKSSLWQDMLTKKKKTGPVVMFLKSVKIPIFCLAIGYISLTLTAQFFPLPL